jgi:hypothetical protein
MKNKTEFREMAGKGYRKRQRERDEQQCRLNLLQISARLSGGRVKIRR